MTQPVAPLYPFLRRRELLWIGIWAPLLLLGLLARIYDLGFPSSLTGTADEYHFVQNARRLLAGAADQNDHPPLGKWLIALGIALAGDNSVGWRCVPCALGCLTVGVAYALVARATRDRTAAGIAAILVALDGCLMAYSRTALLDGMLVFLVLTTLALLVGRISRGILVAASLLVGVAASIKWSGATLLLPLCVVIVTTRRSVGWLLVAGSLALGAYWAVYTASEAGARQPFSPRAIAAEQARLWHEHTKPLRPHPLSSTIPSWLVLGRPLELREDAQDGKTRLLMTLSNPLVWWASSLLMVLSVLAALKYWVFRIPALLGKAGSVLEELSDERRAHWVLIIAWIAPMLPWTVGVRQSFLYHYLPSYGVALCMLAIGLAQCLRRWRVGGAILSGGLLLAAMAYLPFGCQWPVSQSYIDWLLPFEVWR